MKAIEYIDANTWPADVREQGLGALQQYLRNQNMFCFWDISRDCLVPMLSNANFNPKVLLIENSVFGKLGRGNWSSSIEGVIEGLEWSIDPWESISELGTTRKVKTGDPIKTESMHPMCGTSTDLPLLGANTYDLAVTDPPFGDNLYYADLAEFFFQWLRLPLRRLYEGSPESAYFEPERTPHAQEAIENSHEHPDNREGWEKELILTPGILDVLRQLSGDDSLQVGDPNPLYRREPAPDFYRRTLEACWTEAHRVLKPGGLLAFTFHHKDDAPWVDVLESLFEAGYLLTATYPIRSDEIKGSKAQFGSKKIEYDIHVCRKRLEEPEPVSWAKMRRYVREEAARLKKLIEGIHGHELPESDLRIILIGKSLEFYSRHYGQVYTGDATVLHVRDALLGINQILEDLQEANSIGLRLPDGAQPLTRHYLRLFGMQQRVPKDDLSKSLRGTGYSPDEFVSLGWIRTVGSKVEAVPIEERFSRFTTRGRTRGLIKSDLDIAHFLIGAAMPGSKVDIETELRERRVIPPMASDAIIGWYEMTTEDELTRLAANTAKTLIQSSSACLKHWRRRHETKDRSRLAEPWIRHCLEDASSCRVAGGR
jgi:SAM-dependent methyltransferase